MTNETHVSRVQLRTRNLARACEFYERASGFQVVRRERSRVSLSASGHAPALPLLAKDKGAAPRPDHTTGLVDCGQSSLLTQSFFLSSDFKIFPFSMIAAPVVEASAAKVQSEINMMKGTACAAACAKLHEELR
jgi:catechol 2,3-dioxygenase-like lactoylglutathione lyase family enzyme